MTSPYVIQLDLELAETLKNALLEMGFSLKHPPHTLFQGKKPHLTVTLYASGKLVIQGSEMKDFIENYLEPELIKKVEYGYEHLLADPRPRIGVDESGKGDFFGPLAVAGVYAEGKGVGELIQMGVKDSKKLSDVSILKIASSIRKNYLHHIVRIGPEKYNELYKNFGNLNTLLGWGHATAIRTLSEKSKCRFAIVDQFAKEFVIEEALNIKRNDEDFTLIQRPRGEEDPVVAAASILARASFLEGLDQLEVIAKEKLPKGASSKVVEAAFRIAKREGIGILNSIAKIHFSTYDRVKDLLA